METKRMGQGMMLIAILIGLWLMTLFFAGVEERRYNPNQAPLTQLTEAGAEVQLKRNAQGHYVVSGEINGQKVDFLLDTGATDVVVPEGIARKAGLEYGRRSWAKTANGVIDVWNTRIAHIAIGDISLHDTPASINPHSDGAILLGMSALGQVEFVQSGAWLTLRQRAR